MAAHKRAVVLSGGGAKGAYQIGAWRALRELEYRPDIVTGTSVGALNGALMALDRYEEAREIWNTMGMAQVFAFQEDVDPSRLEQFTLRYFGNSILKGGMDSSPLEEMVTRLLDETALRASDIRFGMVATQYPQMKSVELFVEDIPEGLVADYIIASASAYPIMKSRKIEDRTYIDGGFTDNMPVRMALRAGATELTVINIGTMPGSATQGEDVVMHYVRARHALSTHAGGMLLFDTELSQRNMQLGYLDTYKCFGRYDGCLYTFDRFEKFKVSPFEPLCAAGFSRTFSVLPGASAAEKNGRKSVQNFLQGYEDDPFSTHSNTLHCLEAAADLFEISPLEVYTISGLTAEIRKQMQLQTEQLHHANESDALLSRLRQSLTSSRMRSVLESIDRKLFAILCAGYLLQPAMTPEIKQQLWAVATVAPAIFCAALFCAAALTIENTKIIMPEDTD